MFKIMFKSGATQNLRPAFNSPYRTYRAASDAFDKVRREWPRYYTTVYLLDAKGNVMRAYDAPTGE